MKAASGVLHLICAPPSVGSRCTVKCVVLLAEWSALLLTPL